MKGAALGLQPFAVGGIRAFRLSGPGCIPSLALATVHPRLRWVPAIPPAGRCRQGMSRIFSRQTLY